MPGLVWLYLTALLYHRTSGSCVALAEALRTVSHDRLTRRLRGGWSGHTLLDQDYAFDLYLPPKPYPEAVPRMKFVPLPPARSLPVNPLITPYPADEPRALRVVIPLKLLSRLRGCIRLLKNTRHSSRAVGVTQAARKHSKLGACV
jgi:hypothetical protein